VMNVLRCDVMCNVDMICMMYEKNPLVDTSMMALAFMTVV